MNECRRGKITTIAPISDISNLCREVKIQVTPISQPPKGKTNNNTKSTYQHKYIQSGMSSDMISSENIHTLAQYKYAMMNVNVVAAKW